mmetsp:Transcript_4908/g.11684  ORF Transcript_4908/g.11684 Transcript_4908/m.11684 type:complete len:97 (+) Transcript_4908:2015-2305(+)
MMESVALSNVSRTETVGTHENTVVVKVGALQFLYHAWNGIVNHEVLSRLGSTKSAAEAICIKTKNKKDTFLLKFVLLKFVKSVFVRIQDEKKLWVS